MPTTIEISTKTIIKILLFIGLAILVYILRDIFIILFFALVIASAVNTPVEYLEKLKIPRIIGVLIIYGVVFSIFVFIVYQIVPTTIKELQLLNKKFPDIIDSFFNNLKIIGLASGKYFDIISRIQNYILSLANSLKSAVSSFLETVSYFFGGATSTFSILIISFYLSVQKRGVERFIKAVFPKNYEDYILNLWARSQRKMSQWLQGQIILCLSIGILTYIGLRLLGIQFALILAVIAGLLEIIPISGPVISAIPAVILGILQNPILGLWVIVLYIIVQQVENHFLVPIVMAKAVGLNPILIIMSLLIGAKLFGIFGVILSVPMAAVVVEAINDYLKKADDKIEFTIESSKF